MEKKSGKEGSCEPDILLVTLHMWLCLIFAIILEDVDH